MSENAVCKTLAILFWSHCVKVDNIEIKDMKAYHTTVIKSQILTQM